MRRVWRTAGEIIEVIAEARRRTEAGETMDHVASDLSICEKTLRKYGVTSNGRRGPVKKLTPEKKARAIELLKAGATQLEAARAVGVSRSLINKHHIQGYGKRGRPYQRVDHQKVAEARRRVASGEDIKRVAAEVGISKSTMERYGITAPQIPLSFWIDTYYTMKASDLSDLLKLTPDTIQKRWSSLRRRGLVRPRETNPSRPKIHREKRRKLIPYAGKEKTHHGKRRVPTRHDQGADHRGSPEG